MPFDPACLETALEITGSFEAPGNPFAGVSGDFDGEGISVGVLQWNVGQGSLQPLIKKAGKAAVIQDMPIYGSALWEVANSSIPEGLAIVRGWQSNHNLNPDAKRELRAFAGGQAFKDQQIAAATAVGRAAARAADDFAAKMGWGVSSVALNCWFFDLYTQNGGLKTVTSATVNAFITGHEGLDAAVDQVCDWLESQPLSMAGGADAHRNGAAWRTSAHDQCRTLLVTSCLRAQLSRTAWRADTLNRKGTLAMGRGWVHSTNVALSNQLGPPT